MRVAVLGAKGRLSHAVAKAFLAAGHDVVAITRDGRCPGLEGRVTFRAADAMSREELVAATEGVDLIFNGLNPPYDQWQTKAMPMARNVIAACKAHGVPQLFAGNVYNYGHAISIGTKPETPHSPDTRKGRIRIEMEALFSREAIYGGVQTVVLRAGDFYGTSGKGSWFDLFLVKDVEKGRFVWPGPADIPHAFAYLPDLARAFVALAERMGELPAFDTFTFAGHTLTGSDFRRHVEAALGRPLKPARLPWWLLRLASPFHGMAREVLEMKYLWNTPHSLDGTKLGELVGELPQTPPAAAIRQALVDQGKLAA